MRFGRFVLISAAVLASIVFAQTKSSSLQADATTALALSGHVSSQEEGLMEGVLVSARRAGSPVTITVVSDSQGLYKFPRSRLEPGQYSLRIRAVGYELDDSGNVQISSQETATADLKLHKTQKLSSQLNSAEWLLSIPGTDAQKTFLLNCTNCHTLERVVKSSHDANEWVGVFGRMAAHAPESDPAHPQERVGPPEPFGTPDALRKQAEYMSTINLSAVDKWAYSIKTLPRPSGRATHVIITEYDLPRPETMPHDVVVDDQGMVWYTDFGHQFLGKLDPRTAQAVEFPVPQLKTGFPVGLLDLERDKHGNLWMGEMLQGGLAEFEPQTQKISTWSLPKEANNDSSQINMVMPINDGVDGKVWLQDNGSPVLHRLDLSSGRIETFDLYNGLPEGIHGHSVYDVLSDSANNAYFTDLAGGNIGKVDGKTGKVTLYPTPTRISGPRRGRMDAQDRLWFGEYRGNRVAMFDSRTAEFQEWAAPDPWMDPYDAVLGKNGEVWAGSITSDRVLRLDPKTGAFIEYLLPRYSTIRRVFVDNSTNPGTFWAGNNHGASIIKLEPLD
jgi:virginiamycin B lyase